MNRYDTPHMVWALCEDITPAQGRRMAQRAVAIARGGVGKVNGKGARNLQPIWGPNWYGIQFPDDYMWFQEAGTKPFTMRNLAGKTIPMWVEDKDGKERQKNPKIKTRRTKDGRTQVLIFRRAGHIGAKKSVRHPKKGWRSVPASYPGAPGRISVRHARKPYTTSGKVAGAIHARNVGVRWRHPGLRGRHFLFHGVQRAGAETKVTVYQIVAEWPDGKKEELTGY